MTDDQDVAPIALLDALWDALKDNYPAFEFVVGATGDAWRDEFRARLEPADGLPDAYPVLEELVNRFHDYHTGFYWPGKPAFQTPEGIRLGRVEGAVAVVSAMTPAMTPAVPLLPGDVLLMIDGQDAEGLYEKSYRRRAGRDCLCPPVLGL